MGDLSESKCGQCPGTCGARSLSLHSSSPLTLTSISCSVSSFGATTTKLAGALLAACRQTRRDGTRISFHGFVFFWCVCVFLVGFLFVWFVDFGFVPFNRTFIPRQLFFCSPYSPPCSVCVCVCVCGLHSIEEHLQQGSMCGNQVRVLPDTQVQVGDPSCPINEHGTIPCTGPFRRRHPLDRLHSRASGGHRGTPFFSPCSRFQIHRMKFPCSHTTRRGVALQYTPPTQDIESHAG